MELGDSMDLSSYLLKPVQRISKYSLLLQEILEDCVSDQSEEKQEIQAALDVVRFQLRHGNDLLTMDAIRGCDVSHDVNSFYTFKSFLTCNLKQHFVLSCLCS